MTSTTLLLLVCGAIGLQAAIALLLAIVRHSRAHAVSVAPSSAASHAPIDPVVPAWAGWRSLRVIAREDADPSGSVVSFKLAAPDGTPLPRYAPGQYLSLRCTVPDASGRAQALVRCYSLSDRWQADHYRISIKRVTEPQPGVVSNHLHAHLQVGDSVEARAPAGHFVLAPGAEPLVLIAGGIGLTPLLAMLETVLIEAPARRVWLFYGVRHGGEHALRARLAELAAAHPQLRLHVRYSRPRAEDVIGRDFDSPGHLDIALLRQTLPLQAMQFYVCGPAPLLATLVPALQAWGVDAARIHYEAFGPSSLPAAPAPASDGAQAGAPVVFAKQGRTLNWDPAAGNLLAFAEHNGIALDFACRAGSCGTCALRVVSGRVHYAHAPDADVPPDHCLPCIATPATALELAA